LVAASSSSSWCGCRPSLSACSVPEKVELAMLGTSTATMLERRPASMPACLFGV
jgi:hypothetical protein